MSRIVVLMLLLLLAQGCTPLVVAGAAVGTTAKVAVGVAKVPVKAAGAAIDVVTDGEDQDE